MKSKRTQPIPASKLKSVKELKELLGKKTILIASIKNLPASQYQEISKKLRGKAIVKVPKKNLMFRAIDESKNEDLKKLKDKIDNSVAILFSDMDSFDLASDLLQNKTAARAKTGQEAPEDIEVQAGPTDLPPGPAISELGALGIQIQIEKGKISIKQPKVIVKKGEKISAGAAGVMSKLDIKPFSVGFVPLSAFDTKENIFYVKMNIDREGTIAKLKEAYTRSLPFAVEIGHVNKNTLKYLLAKAHMHGKALEKFNTLEVKSESPKASEDETSSGEEN